MKKHLALLIGLFLATVGITEAANSYVLSLSTGEKFQTSKLSSLERTESKSGDNIVVSYTIDEILIEPDTLYTGTNWCFLDDFGRTYKAGTPSLPIRIDNVRLPIGADSARVELTRVSYQDIHCPITPAHPYLSDEGERRYTKENVPPITSSELVSTNNMISVRDFESTMNHYYVNVEVTPCMYDLATETLRVATKLEYIVTPIFSSSANITEELKTTRVERINNASNTQISILSIEKPYDPGEALYVTDESIFTDIYKSYLIVTCDKYMQAAQKLALLKKKMGYKTYITSRSSWSTKQITDSIQKYAKNRDYTLESVVLLGGFKDLPAPTYKRIITEDNHTSEYNFSSDFYFGCLGGTTDLTQDVLLGRIPANSLSELNGVVKKITDYFYNPSNLSDYYSTGLHAAYCADSNIDYDDHIKNSEDCREIALSAGIDVIRLYGCKDTKSPKFFSSNTTRMPNELQPGYLSWATDKYAISNEINCGGMYVLYRGHGSTEGWNLPSFTKNDLSLLTNSTELPIFFNTTCSSGKYNDTISCFAEEILKMPNGGAIGVIAGSERTRTDFNNIASPDLMRSLLIDSKNAYYLPNRDYVYDDDGYPCSSVLGKLLQNFYTTASTKNYPHTQLQKEIYHLFGDPSLMLYTSLPEEFLNNEVWEHAYYKPIFDPVIYRYEITHEDVQINTDDEGCFVGVYDTENDLSFLLFGTKIFLPYFDPVRYEMTIYGQNRVPKVIHKERVTTQMIQPNPIPYLKILPNPVSSTAEIQYNFQTNSMDNIYGEIQIWNLSTGYHYKNVTVTDHSGKVYVDVSGFPSGEYSVKLFKKNSSGVLEVIHTEKMIVR